VRRREADRLSLVRDDVGVLIAGRGAVDGEKAEAGGVAREAGGVAREARAGDDERLRVGLVFDLAEPGSAVGVEEAE
jgi:hypothetical protein